MSRECLIPKFIRDEEGRVRAMHVRVRPGPAVTSVQPNPSHLVFFYLGADGWPVGIKFLEPVQGIAATQLLTKLIESPTGAPVAVDQRMRYHFWPIEEIKRAVQALMASSEIPSPEAALPL